VSFIVVGDETSNIIGASLFLPSSENERSCRRRRRRLDLDGCHELLLLVDGDDDDDAGDNRSCRRVVKQSVADIASTEGS